MTRLILALLLVCGVAQAAETKLAPGTWRGQAIVTIVVDAAGNQTVTVDPSAPLVITGGGGIAPPPGPGPVIPTPPGTLTEAVKVATAAIPEYPDKANHRRAMAFGMTFLAQATSSAPVVNSRATVRQFCDAAAGADAPKWAGWWATVDAKLNASNLTPATYTAALIEMSAALTADLPATSAPAELNGNKTFGLSPELIRILMEILLPLLLKLLGLTALVQFISGLT